jgi:predicted MFS family arabinose efflux permease
VHTVTTPRYLQGFATTALLTIGGFMLNPFMSDFTVHNLGVSLQHLPWIYAITGLCSIIAGPFIIGPMADVYGKFRVFAFGCIVTILAVTVYTHLGITPLSLIVLVSVLLFVGVSSRMITASALISAIPAAADRGSYMAISSSLQSFAGGGAAAVGGLIVTERSDGALLHFDMLGYVLTVTTLISLALMYRIQRRIEGAPRPLSASGAGTALGNPPPLAAD